MEQCRVENRRTGEKAMANIKVFIEANIKVFSWLSNPKGTLVYTKQMQTLKADFWKEGVGGSKRILKKILKKITNYEEQHVNLDEEVNKKLGRRFRRLGKGEKKDQWMRESCIIFAFLPSLSPLKMENAMQAKLRQSAEQFSLGFLISLLLLLSSWRVCLCAMHIVPTDVEKIYCFTDYKEVKVRKIIRKLIRSRKLAKMDAAL